MWLVPWWIPLSGGCEAFWFVRQTLDSNFGFLINKKQEFGVRSKSLVPDKFVYSHYLFAG